MSPSLPGKRLALFFDGTWNVAESNTSVWRLNLMLADKGDDGVPQQKFYDDLQAIIASPESFPYCSPVVKPGIEREGSAVACVTS